MRAHKAYKTAPPPRLHLLTNLKHFRIVGLPQPATNKLNIKKPSSYRYIASNREPKSVYGTRRAVESSISDINTIDWSHMHMFLQAATRSRVALTELKLGNHGRLGRPYYGITFSLRRSKIRLGTFIEKPDNLPPWR